jgi:2-oxoglutarate ferredoxin oxidoreductase subunit beta
VAADMQLPVEHGLPLLFGKDRTKGLRIKHGKFEMEIVTVGENGVTLDDILVHDERNKVMAMMLANLEPPAFPVATGVLYCDPAPSYEQEVFAQAAAAGAPKDDVGALIHSGRTWQVE